MSYLFQIKAILCFAALDNLLTLQMPTYASMQIDTRSVEEKFATLKDDTEEEDDKLSEPAQFSDAEAEEDLGEIVTVGEGEED